MGALIIHYDVVYEGAKGHKFRTGPNLITEAPVDRCLFCSLGLNLLLGEISVTAAQLVQNPLIQSRFG